MIEGLDPVFIAKLTSDQAEQVTCVECCKYYIAPETASCGHTLCHDCWKGRRICHTCAAPVNKRSLKLNIPLQALTEHVHALSDAFEKLFNVKLAEFALGVPDDMQTHDPTSNVKEWLASSQNHFSGPVISSQVSETEAVPILELSKSNIQIHGHRKEVKKLESPQKVVFKPQSQKDWDKIEVLPDSEDTTNKPEDHVIGPVDCEPFLFCDNEYTTDNPRRSSRKRELKTQSNPPAREVSVDKNSDKYSNNTDNKSVRTKQTWNNVKKMRKEFSKLNKMNKSKLNVSIELCKKAQSAVNKAKPLVDSVESGPLCLNIDDNTPVVTNKKPTPQKNVIQAEQEEIRDEEADNEKILNVNENNLLDVTNRSVIKSQNKQPCNEFENPVNNSNTVESKLLKDTKVNNHDSIHNSNTKNTGMPFIKKSALCKEPANANIEESHVQITQNEIDGNIINTNTDVIEISIKIGNTITNFVIKNKKNDVQMKVNTDRAIQTSLGPHRLNNKQDASCSPMTDNIKVNHIELNVEEGNKVVINKSTKKNTPSADTATAKLDITDSADKDLSDVMECLESKTVKTIQEKQKIAQTQLTQPQNIASDIQEKNNENIENNNIDDLDIFNSGSVKETTVKLLKDTKYAASEILPSAKVNKFQKTGDKRDRDLADIDNEQLPSYKKQKIDTIMSNKDDESDLQTDILAKNLANDSQNMNYDMIMSQVFANIDADIQLSGTKSVGNTKGLKPTIEAPVSHTIQSEVEASQIIHKTQIITNKNRSISGAKNSSQANEVVHQKYSENMFSVLEKDSEPLEGPERNNKQLSVASSTQQQIDNLLTPGMCQEMAGTECNTQANKDIEMIEPVLGTPMVEHDDDSDKSVVEETPQKNISFTKPKQTEAPKSTSSSTSVPGNKQAGTESQKHPNFNSTSDSQIIRSIINISDTLDDNNKTRDNTIVEIAKKKQTLETPLNISKFVNHIMHNSTPIAKKSLNFENDNLDDLEQTLCPTTTQEKEFMAKAFEKTQSPVRKPLQLRNVSSSSTKAVKKFYIAGSCLTSAEVKEVKRLCLERGWVFLDKYTDELTHLVVGVDEENKSQRSVKYMCALAASKWIVTFSWVEKCLESKTIVVDELPYEALDACGEPGPRRSRTALMKVFEGITFFCMRPFSMLDIDTLKLMLTSAGGLVVEDHNRVTVTEENGYRPALLLAEPEHTQEDKFVFLAMKHKLVPVNYEWVLNCLGTYSLGSIHELLLCPASLLPPETARWPEAMMRQEDDDEVI